MAFTSSLVELKMALFRKQNPAHPMLLVMLSSLFISCRVRSPLRTSIDAKPPPAHNPQYATGTPVKTHWFEVATDSAEGRVLKMDSEMFRLCASVIVDALTDKARRTPEGEVVE